MNTSPFAELLTYTSHGWPVFPVYEPRDGRCSCGAADCESQGKHPRIKGWQTAATTDLAQIERWAAQFPGCNWGMPTGPASGVDVLDEDPRHDGDKTLAEFQAVNGTLPETVRVLTQSDGTHRLFRSDPAHVVKNGTNVLGPGIDVRGDGGFVVIPPSVGLTGRPYRFDLAAHPDDVQVADWTEPLLKRVNGAAPGGTLAPRLDVPSVLAGVPEGHREEMIFKLSCKLRRADVPEEAALDLVLKAAANAVPPFPAGEAEERLHRAYRTYPAGQESITLKVSSRLTEDQKAGLSMAEHSEAPRIREAEYIDLFNLLYAPPEEIPWQLRGYMSRGEWVTISGEWGSGKSLTAMDLGIALATGTSWMGHVPVVGGPYSVLYVDEENGRKLAERRLRQLFMGRKITPEQARLIPLRYAARAGVRLDDPSWRDWLRREIEKHEARHLFLDSLIRFARIKENSNDENAAFFGDVIQPLMNEYDLTIVALDHMGKPSKDRTDLGHRGRGASEKPGANDELICMDGERGQDTRTISHEKTRWHQYQPALVTTCTESADETECWLEAREEKPEVADVVARHLMNARERGVLREDIIEFVAATLKGKGTDKSVSRALKTLKDQNTVKAKTEGKKVRYWSACYAPADAK